MKRRSAYLGFAIAVALIATALIGSYQETRAEPMVLPIVCGEDACTVPKDYLAALLLSAARGCVTLEKKSDS